MSSPSGYGVNNAKRGATLILAYRRGLLILGKIQNLEFIGIF